jgi:hypothetical protein
MDILMATILYILLGNLLKFLIAHSHERIGMGLLL